MPLPSVREELAWQVGQNTVLTVISCGLPQSLQGKTCIGGLILLGATISSLKTLFSSLFTNHPTIRSYIAGVAKLNTGVPYDNFQKLRAKNRNALAV